MEIGKEILKIRLSDIDKHSNGVFIERLTSDASDIAFAFKFSVSRLHSLISDLGILVIVFTINVWIGLFYILRLIINFILQKIEMKVINKYDIMYRNQREQTSGFSAELIRGIRDIKMLNAENSFMSKVEENISKLNVNHYNMFKVNRIYSFITSFINKLFDFILILLIVYFVSHGNIPIALGIVIYNYRYSSMGLSYEINDILRFARNFNLSCDRVFSLFGSEEFQKEEFGDRHLDEVKGNFEFQDVEFSYDKKQVLKKMSFKVNTNETVAFVGKSGAGKTTIFNLLCRFYTPDNGTIKIDDVDISKLDKDTIRSNITLISQSPYIFNMSIRDNLAIVKDNMSEEEMIEACKLACIHDFIETLPDKYDTLIGEAGINLSGGQRQRLAIARAFIQKTKIILFDEATSSLDNETQAEIQKSIDSMNKNYTILIIAHRLSTIINSNRILFVDDGKIVAEGTHEYLLANNSNYRKLYEKENKQMSSKHISN